MRTYRIGGFETESCRLLLLLLLQRRVRRCSAALLGCLQVSSWPTVGL